MAIALLAAAATDIRARRIGNALTGGIALLAPATWWAGGLPLWPGVAAQLAMAVAVLAVLAAPFAAGAMGGGDVKLLAALALWLPWRDYLELVVLTALLGGVVTMAWLAGHRLARRSGVPEIPYGVAIAAAGLWVIGSAGAGIGG